jgi:hypothetical protein
LLRETQIEIGGVASAFHDRLCLRGLRTLSSVSKVGSGSCKVLGCTSHGYKGSLSWPFLSSSTENGGTANEKRLWGSLSFELENVTIATAVAGALQTIQDTETLMEHRASIEPLIA